MAQHSPSRWRLVIETLAATPRLMIVWALLPVLGIRRLRRLTHRMRPSTAKPPAPDRLAARVVALRRVSARLPGCYCLARSMALSWWLSARGVPHALRIGVRGNGRALHAHSWVEIDGVPVDDQPRNVSAFRHLTTI
ncbi:MAG: hypothetical protein Kow0020_14210 [Wenzhouxiangellaceae bacterium]